MDTLANYEKMGDHVRNIGRAMRDGIIKVGPELRAALEAETGNTPQANTVEV